MRFVPALNPLRVLLVAHVRDPLVMMRRFSWCVLALTMLTSWIQSAHAALSAEASDALAWYSTLGFPDAKDLPYVRVATGAWHQSGNGPRENTYVEGLLVGEEPDAFTVFICSVSEFKDRFEMFESYAPLTTVRFVRQASGPEHLRVGYETQDFKKVAAEVLDRVQALAAHAPNDLQWGRSLAHRARIFAFASVCLQKDLSETASTLMGLAANIPDEQNGKRDPSKLRENLQRQIGDAVLNKAEEDFGNEAISWVEMLNAYDHFDTRFPASPKVAYAQEAAATLRKMIAEDAEHHPKPLDQMSPAEQAAENIYQLRNLGHVMWIMYNRYPLDSYTSKDKEVITPVHRLMDLGNAAIPQLIEALDDRRFTHIMVDYLNGLTPPKVMRVGDVVQRILEHRSGRIFFARKTDDGRLLNDTTRQQAEAWWAEMLAKGEQRQLVDAAVLGGEAGCTAARKLVEKYPDAALDAIEEGIRVTTHEGIRGEYVQVAAGLPREAPLAFLRSQLTPDHGLYSQVHAAEGLFARGQPDAIPAMIEAWRKVQPRLPANESDAYSEIGGLITFLAKSGDANAIAALGQNLPKAPVDVRLAVVEVFLPWPRNGGMSANGRSVHVDADIQNLPIGAASLAIEHLLAAALEDTGRRREMKGTYNEVSYEDPRICDMAALVLSKRWPDKYRFQWVANEAECDAQIAELRHR